MRDVTTQVLPDFIRTCLSLIKSPDLSRALLESRPASSVFNTVIETLSTLTPTYPTHIRPFLLDIQAVIGDWLAPTTYEGVNLPFSKPSLTCSHARHLLVLLHASAPQNTSGQAWNRAFQNLLRYLHYTADIVFRPIVEDWKPNSATAKKRSFSREPLHQDVADPTPGPFGIPGWSGPMEGVVRLSGLLRMIEAFVTSKTSTSVTVPLADIYDAIDRILLIVKFKDNHTGRIRPEIQKNERDILFIHLPLLHIQGLKVIHQCMESFGPEILPAITNVQEQMLWVFQNEKASSDIRGACYVVTAKILNLVGPSMTKKQSERFFQVYRTCCNDIMATDDSVIPSSYLATSTKGAANSFSSAGEHLQDFEIAASRLLPVVLRMHPAQYLTREVRQYIDNAIIMTQDEEGLLASTMNPPRREKKGQSLPSLLPFLAQQNAKFGQTEALVRPQMPVLLSDAHLGSNIPVEIPPNDQQASSVKMQLLQQSKRRFEEEDGLQRSTTTIAVDDDESNDSTTAPTKSFQSSAQMPSNEDVSKNTQATVIVPPALLPRKRARTEKQQAIVEPPSPAAIADMSYSVHDEDDDDSDGPIPTITIDTYSEEDEDDDVEEEEESVN